MGNGQSARPRRLTPHEVESTKIGSYTDLASSALGSRVVQCSDEFFGKAENLTKPANPNPSPSSQTSTEHDEDADGWETRRHSRGHDFVIIAFAYAGTLTGFDIDTTNFVGDHAHLAAVDACFVGSETGGQGGASYKWEEILPKITIDPNTHNVFSLPLESTDPVYDHVRLRIYPDGGVARFRVFGNVVPVWGPKDSDKLVDLAFIGNGGRVVSCSNDYFAPMGNLNLPGRAEDTRGGWLTKRNWSSFAREGAVIHLGVTGLLSGCEVDTAHFLGNHPHEVSVEGCYSMEERPEDDVDVNWATLLPRTSVGPDALHRFDFFEAVRGLKFTHVRVLIFPDGGLSRVRIFGTVDPDAAGTPAAEASKSGAAAFRAPPASGSASKQRHPLSQSTTDFGEVGAAPRGIVRRQTKASLRSVRSSSSNVSDAGTPGSKRKRTR